MPVRRFRFIGNLSSIGLQHGESLRNEIHDLASERIDIICSSNPKVTYSDVQKVSEECSRQTKLQTPEVYEEFSGISQGANIDLWKLMVAGGYSDIDHRTSLNDEATRKNISECTLLPVRKDQENILLIGTWDSHATAESALVLIERHPDGAPATLALTTAGCPMQQGVTEKHLGFAIANLIPATNQDGITYVSALPRIMSQPDIYKAKQAATKLKLCSGRFYAICDKDGNYIGLETDGLNYWENTTLESHTNHYIYEEATLLEGRKNYRELSEKRRLSAWSRLPEDKDVNPENLISILSFNDGTPDSIAQLGLGREDRSCASFVIDPSNLSITYTKGPPGLSMPETVYLEN